MVKVWSDTTSSFKAMIIGKLLGDGSITRQERRKPRFQFIHTSTDYSWSKYCYEQLLDFLPLNPPKYKKSIDPRLSQGYSLSYYVQSRTSGIITYLRSKWYSDSRKVIPFNLISKYFNEQSLAWWYMDDGHLKQKGSTPEKIILSTESFTEFENNWLINFLLEKYNLQFHLDKQNRIILYDQFQIYYFLFLVTPYMHRSMHRKLITEYTYIYNLAPRRTTIYLPTSIELNYPTREINEACIQLDDLIRYFKKGVFYERYLATIIKKSSVPTKGYQIILKNDNLSKLHFLREVTGLRFSKLIELCFINAA